MRAIAFEKLLKKIEAAVHEEDWLALKQYAAKSAILRSRNNDQAVIRELMNE
jgi:hypothetical protein